MDQFKKMQILKDIIEIPTVNGNESQVAKYLRDLFNQYQIPSQMVEESPGRSDLIAEIGNGKHPKIALEGHEDTVHEGNIDDWHTNPFKAVEKDGRLYGRGSSDMKSGLAAMAIAFIELKENHIKINGTVKFIATISEELNEGGASYLAQNGYIDDLDEIIIGEPTVNDQDKFETFTAHKGDIIYTIESFGKAAHSSKPELGVNAIDKLIDFRIAEKHLFSNHPEKDDELGTTIYTPNVIKGGQQVNSIPDYAYEKVMLRTIPQFSNEQIINELKKLIQQIHSIDPDSNLKLTVNSSSVPVKTTPDELLNSLKMIDQNDVGYPISTKAVSLGTDASQFLPFNKKLKVIILGPGNNTEHQANEYVSIDAYKQSIKLYYDLVRKRITK